MNILIYYQYPNPTIFIESLVQSFIEKGHKVYFLTTCEKGILHQRMEALGSEIVFYKPPVNKFFRFISNWVSLVKCCRKNKIEVVYSHLQYANIIALLGQYFIRGKVFPCRHHVDEVMLVANKNALFIDKLVNKLSKKIIVVSIAAKKQMSDHEKINPDKIIVISLGYNFDLYDKPIPKEIVKIREQMQCRLLLIVIARMTKEKRHIIALEALNTLVGQGFDVKMIMLGSGVEEQRLKIYVSEKKLQEKVLFTGFLNNTMDYLAAADLLLNPSVVEASNQVVKEAALLNKPSIVCKGIGDFDEYINHRQNGFLVSQDNTKEEMVEIIKEFYYENDKLKLMGEKIRKEVLSRFDIKKISEQYLALKK